MPDLRISNFMKENGYSFDSYVTASVKNVFYITLIG